MALNGVNVRIDDLPGSHDNRGADIEVSIAFHNFCFMESIDEVKFLFITDIDKLRTDQGRHFIATYSNFMDTIKRPELLKDHFALMVNKVDENLLVEDLQTRISKIIRDNSINEDYKKFLQHILDNRRLFLFK